MKKGKKIGLSLNKKSISTLTSDQISGGRGSFGCSVGSRGCGPGSGTIHPNTNSQCKCL